MWQMLAMNSGRKGCENDTRKLLLLGKSVSCDNLKANSCIELADIRKLDSLLNQCESISCDNLLLFDDIYNYDLCRMNRRKYASTSAINKILPKNSIRRRAHKKVLGIRESDTKIIKFLDDVRNHRPETDVKNSISNQNLLPQQQLTPIPQSHTPSKEDDRVDEKNVQNECVGNDIMSPKSSYDQNHSTINCFDKNIQTSQIDLTAIATISPPSPPTPPILTKTTNIKCLCKKNDKSSSPKTAVNHIKDHHEKVSSFQTRK